MIRDCKIKSYNYLPFLVVSDQDCCPKDINPCFQNAQCFRPNATQRIQCVCDSGFAGNLCQCEREDFFTPDQNYETLILRWIKMKDKARAFPMNSNKLMYVAFLLKLKAE